MRIKVWQTNCFPPAFEFWTTAEVVKDVVKDAKIQITLNVYAQNCGSNQIHNLAPFSTSLPTSAEECQKFKICPPHFEIENVSNQALLPHFLLCNFPIFRSLCIKCDVIIAGQKKNCLRVKFKSYKFLGFSTKLLIKLLDCFDSKPSSKHHKLFLAGKKISHWMWIIPAS